MVNRKLIKIKLAVFLTLIPLCMGFLCTAVFAQDEVEDSDFVESELETYEETPDDTPSESESAIPEGSGFRPFTPSGTGTVIDNAIDGDGKEFYTVKTEEGNIFYLIIDRQKNTQNVYFLNAVTEEDLMAFVEKTDKTTTTGTSAIPPTGKTGTNGQDPPVTPEPETEKTPGNNAVYILLVIAVAAAGGALYYFKIVKSKKNKTDTDENDGSDENDDEYGYEGETDEYDDEMEELE
ncbi:MAG: DUF4366 domain-containing protein [Oscillospiraceae bacterium]|nr:DUF4366 domain-containing protein [Oscillospiraceae bacterium]